MQEPSWVNYETVLKIHDQQLREHGGLPGIRDEGALRSALARPTNAFHYGNEDVTIFELAAEYGFGISRNHPFLDGNKRTAFVTTKSFLKEAGYSISIPKNDKICMMERIGRGDASAAQMASWLKTHSFV